MISAAYLLSVYTLIIESKPKKLLNGWIYLQKNEYVLAFISSIDVFGSHFIDLVLPKYPTPSI